VAGGTGCDAQYRGLRRSRTDVVFDSPSAGSWPATSGSSAYGLPFLRHDCLNCVPAGIPCQHDISLICRPFPDRATIPLATSCSVRACIHYVNLLAAPLPVWNTPSSRASLTCSGLISNRALFCSRFMQPSAHFRPQFSALTCSPGCYLPRPRLSVPLK